MFSGCTDTGAEIRRIDDCQREDAEPSKNFTEMPNVGNKGVTSVRVPPAERKSEHASKVLDLYSPAARCDDRDSVDADLAERARVRLAPGCGKPSKAG